MRSYRRRSYHELTGHHILLLEVVVLGEALEMPG